MGKTTVIRQTGVYMTGNKKVCQIAIGLSLDKSSLLYEYSTN